MKHVNFKPTGKNSVIPYLIIENVQELIKFVSEIFHAELEFKLDRPNGQIMHAEIRIGDSLIMAGEPMDAIGVVPNSLYIYVPDCDAVYENAIAFGCASIMEPTTMLYAGERYGGVQDKNDVIWWIATHVEDLDPEEQRRRIIQMKENWEPKI